jgi:hypothetical protein
MSDLLSDIDRYSYGTDSNEFGRSRRLPINAVLSDTVIARWHVGNGLEPGRVVRQENAFGDNQRLGPSDWITTVPVSATTANPESMGLPRVGAEADKVHRVAS